MSTDGKNTRIPKFAFGFRRTKVEDETSSSTLTVNSTTQRSTTPTHPSGSRSADSSPKVGRSKSLRLPRPTKYGLKSKSQSPVNDSNGFNDDEDFAPVMKSVMKSVNPSHNTESLLAPRGRSQTISHSSSSNQSSRSNSPSVVGGAVERRRFGYGGAGPRGEVGPNQTAESVDASDHFDRTQRRTQSFTARRHNHVRSDSLGNADKLVPPQYGRNHPSRRSKTPTYNYKVTTTGAPRGEKLPLGRTSSLGRGVQKKEEVNSVANHQQWQKSVITRRASNEGRGKRPSSMVGRETTPDLNTIAHEITSNGQPESRITRPHTSKVPPPLRSRRSQSALDHHSIRDTPSPAESQLITSTTSQTSSSTSSNEGPGVKSYEQPTISSAAKTSRPNSSNSNYRITKQGSFGSQTNLSSISTDSQKHELSKRKSLTNMDSVDGGSGRATPINGRGTPAGRKKGKEDVDTAAISSTTGKLNSGLPPRTPYRVARTMVPPSSGPAGMNELEGSVLLEADDYLRVCHDVKALKTALLRLKRELQTNSTSGTPSTGGSFNRAPGRSRTTPSTEGGGASLADLKKKLKQITTERDKALEEVGSLKKDKESLTSKVTKLTSDLSTLETTHSKLKAEHLQVEGHRNMLLDKVERLHADKHKLEDRLTTYEKASIYEQMLSESWLDDVDGDDSLLDIEEEEEYEGSGVNDPVT